MNEGSRAVFLSYASQDADAARRIAEALRASGIEVWFDQNELVGGDAWDAKIRSQIAACALFVPIISAATQARREGYFRLEWKLAAQRTHMIADGTPFLLPVVIDDTLDAEALVPAEFKAVQWTRLRPAARDFGGQAREDGGLTGFCARVQRLLGREAEVSTELPVARATLRPSGTNSGPNWRGLAVAATALTLAAAVFVWRPWAGADATASTPPPQNARSTQLPSAPATEAQQLLAKIAAIVEREADASREDWELAETLGAQAVKLEPANAEAWAAYAQSALGLYEFYIDRGRSPLPDALKRAQQAVSLAPQSPAARLALANCYRLGLTTRTEAEPILRELLATQPTDRFVLRALASVLRGKGAFDDLQSPAARAALYEALELYDRATAQPGGDPAAWREKAAVFTDLGRYAEAEAALEQSLALRRGPSALVRKLMFLLLVRHDLDAAAALIQTFPGSYALREDVVEWVTLTWLWRGDNERLLRSLTAWNHDMLSSTPTGFLVGRALQLLQRPEAARVAWREALDTVEREAAAATLEPVRAGLRLWKSHLHALLGDLNAAEENLRVYEQREGLLRGSRWAAALVSLGRHEQALDFLESRDPANTGRRTRFDGRNFALLLRASLRFDPQWNPLRQQPRFQALVAAIKAPYEPTPPAKPTAAPDEKSVAVLPFTNLSDDKANEYFSDGISEELLTTLQKIPGLRVAARTSAFSFKGQNATAQEIGAKLAVAHLVEGSVQKAGNRVKITARLSRAATGAEVWSQSFGPLKVADVFVTQSEIAQAIITELRGRLAGESAVSVQREIRTQVEAATRGGTRNPAAHQLYLQGRFLARSGSSEVARGIAYYEQALQQDPNFALAWAALARARLWQGQWEQFNATRFDQARTAANRAIALVPDLADAHSTLSQVLLRYDFNWRGAREASARALALAPADAAVLTDAAATEQALGDLSRAIEIARRAVALDPVSIDARLYLGMSYLFANQLTAAEAELRRMIEISPSGICLYANLGNILLLQGRNEEALEAALREPEKMYRYQLLAAVYHSRGQKSESDAVLTQMREEVGEPAAYLIAWAYGWRRQFDEAFHWLERAYQQRDAGISWLRSDTVLRALHADPRWPAFLRKVGLTEEQLK